MKVLFAAAEIAPLVKVGGLADVVRSLPTELINMGHDARVIVPAYGFLDYNGYKWEQLVNDMMLFSLQRYHKIKIKKTALDVLPVYLVFSDFFTNSPYVYGEDEIEKFFIFCDAVSQCLPYLDWEPDIIHCHDWHTALLPMMIRNRYAIYRNIFTIHNIKYQGNFDENTLSRSGLEKFWQGKLPGGASVPWNFMAQGILWSDVINTVSENFSREILTGQYSFGMQDLLNIRRDSLYGIINGLGKEEYDPETDVNIPFKFSYKDISGKYLNRERLQNELGFKLSSEIPLIGMVSRLEEQKGLDIIIEAVPEVLKSVNARFIFLGTGKEYYEKSLIELETSYPHNVRTRITYDNHLAHMIYAGSDLFLMPSKWEPCGLGQMIAMRYGTVPVVRRTGGLADTVVEMNDNLDSGTGFIFDDYLADALKGALLAAIQAFNSSRSWDRVIRRIMQQDFSWQSSARKYEQLYKRALGSNNSGKQ